MLAACEWWTLTYGQWEQQGRPSFTIAVLPALYSSVLVKAAAPPLSPLTQSSSRHWIASGLCFTVTKTEPSILYAQWKRYTELTSHQNERFSIWMKWEVDLHVYSLLWPLQRILLPCSTLTFPPSFFSLYITWDTSFIVAQYGLLQKAWHWLLQQRKDLHDCKISY